jgi:hypothetical protein
VYQQIRFAKKKSWSNFLNKTIKKEVFQAYKFIKNNRIKKLSWIQYEEKTNIEFENKYNTFVEVKYFESLNIKNINDENEIKFNLNSNSFKWLKLIESKFRQTIFTFALNKTLKSNQLIFLIIQEVYSSILNVFFLFYAEFVYRDHHFVCWRKKIETILKKLNKSNYIVLKVYRINILLNCLEKKLKNSWYFVYFISNKYLIYLI